MLAEFSCKEGVDADAEDGYNEYQQSRDEQRCQLFGRFGVVLFSVAEEQEKGCFGSAFLDDLGRGRVKTHGPNAIETGVKMS
jgi:hypothetical protein